MRTTFKHLLASLVALLVAEGMTAATYSGTCGTNVNWSLNTSTGILSITGNGAMTDYNGSTPWSSYRDDIKTITFGSGVTSIGNLTFQVCKNLTQIQFSSTITKIGRYAFGSCTGLTRISIPNSVTTIDSEAFRNCSNVTSLSIGSSVNKIGSSAFEGINISTLNLPESVKTIDSYAFKNCNNLTSITIGTSVENIHRDCFKGTKWLENKSEGLVYLGHYLLGYKGVQPTDLQGVISIQTGTTAVASQAFYDCSSLEGAIIPNSVISIGSGAFKCKSIVLSDGDTDLKIEAGNFQGSFIDAETVYMGRNIVFKTSNGYSAFGSKLTNVRIGPMVTSLCTEIFAGSYGLTKITIPKNVLSIGDYAFDYTLKKIIIEDSNAALTIGRSICPSYQGTPYKYGLFNMSRIDSIYVGRDLTYEVASSATSTGGKSYYGAPFENNDSLRYVEIGDSVTTIGKYCFYNCKNLKTIKIGASMSKLESYAFQSSGLDTVYISTQTPPVGSIDICSPKIVVYVPSGAGIAYRSKYPWSSHIIIDGSEDIININVDQPGSLASKIIQQGTLPKNVTMLKVSGTLNDSDWGVLTYSSMPLLRYLDLSNVQTDSIPSKQFQSGSFYSSSSIYPVSQLMEIKLPTTLKRIGDYAFDNCYRLSGELTLTSTIEEIGIYAMRNTSLKSITLPDKDSECHIDSCAFYYNTALEKADIGKNWTLGTQAFAECSAMTNLTMGHDANIGMQAFYNNKKLTNIRLSGHTFISVPLKLGRVKY